jgi:DNA repair protein RecN (Recombination protein N)
MLKHLRITNFAILSDVSLELGAGFNVLTGETGAGKSLIVDAVALLRGARASADIPRAGADEAVVEAVFEPPADMSGQVAARLEVLGLRAGDDGEVLVRRVISRGGRSRVHVNGGLTTAAALQELGGLLVDLAGQHEHQGLVDPSRHLDVLDAFGVDAGLVAAAAGAYERLRAAAAALGSAASDQRTRAQREDFLRFQLDELEAARVVAGEERELGQERERLRSAGKLGGAARKGEALLYSGDGAVSDVLAGLARELEPLVAIDGRLAAPARSLSEARALLDDAAHELRRYAESLADDPERLAELEDRLHLVGKLCKKHGVADSAALCAAQAAMSDELAGLVEHDSRKATLAGELEACRAAAARAAGALSDARAQAAKRLEKAAAATLGELGMGGARVTVSLGPKRTGDDDELGAALLWDGRRLGPRGWDRVELLLAANKGEEARPLAKIASGGELSRIMLALKLALKRADAVATYVFDEVDSGIGGAIAEVVGRQIQRVAGERQVICVTHLAQIAALADVQFRVEKYEKDGRVETKVERLSANERREELARMLGGLKITPKTRAHAEELLQRGRETGEARPGRHARA